VKELELADEGVCADDAAAVPLLPAADTGLVVLACGGLTPVNAAANDTGTKGGGGGGGGGGLTAAKAVARAAGVGFINTGFQACSGSPASNALIRCSWSLSITGFTLMRYSRISLSVATNVSMPMALKVCISG